jgi:hypothetical protein
MMVRRTLECAKYFDLSCLTMPYLLYIKAVSRV